MHYSPLRYPGGKAKLAPLMKLLIQKTGHTNGVFVEPMAGGAGIALDCPINGVVPEIVINDSDNGIFSFWLAILNETDRFINDVMSVPLTISEWDRQRQIYLSKSDSVGGYDYDLGFATFYLNRTNRSGILKGGVIGGREQDGKYKMDMRFNRKSLVAKILTISAYKNRILVCNMGVCDFLLYCEVKYAGNALLYLDPPYYQKGKQLYKDYFTEHDHESLRRAIGKLHNVDWVLSYDNCPEVNTMYWGAWYRDVVMNYSLARKRHTSEIMFFSSYEMIPTAQELEANNIKTILY